MHVQHIWGLVKMRGCGADLEQCENAGRIYRPIGVYDCTNLRIYVSGQAGLFTYLLTYLLISLKRSRGLYESTELPINQSLYHYVLQYPTDLQICTWICGAVRTDLRGCL